MAVEKETQFEAWLEENMSEPGGNPNTIEVYTGTTSTIMNNVNDLEELMTAISEGNATAMLTIPSLQDITVSGIIISGGLLFGAAFFASPEDTEPTAGAAYFYVEGSVSPIYGKILFGGQWNDARTVNCVLTIIRHPLPEN